MSDQYTCTACGGVFERTRSDEEAVAECIALFGEHRDDDAMVCNDCWLIMTETRNAGMTRGAKLTRAESEPAGACGAEGEAPFNPLDAPLTDEERNALRTAIICRGRGKKGPLTHRDLKALAQAILAAHRYMAEHSGRDDSRMGDGRMPQRSGNNRAGRENDSASDNQ